MIKIVDSVFNRLEWREIKPDDLRELLERARLKDIELCEYPLTDGAIFYLECEGGLRAVSVDLVEDHYQPYLTIRIAEVPLWEDEKSRSSNSREQ